MLKVKRYQIPLDVLCINVLTQFYHTSPFIIIITISAVHSVHTVRCIHMCAHKYHMSILLNKFLNIQIELKPTSMTIHSMRMNWNDVSRAFIEWKARIRHIMWHRITLILINLIRKYIYHSMIFFSKKKNTIEDRETVQNAMKRFIVRLNKTQL